jgi:multiple antibiotic resistance protein
MASDILRHAVATAAALFPIVNPLAAAPAFFSLTERFDERTRRATALRAALYTMAILVVVLFTGEGVFNLFGIDIAVLEVAGGLLVARTGWLMATGAVGELRPEEGGGDIAFVPVALPLLAGPGAIGVTIALSADYTGAGDYAGALLGIAAIGALTYALLLLAGPITRRLGVRGISALTTIAGFLVLAIGVGLAAEGINELLDTSTPTEIVP